MKKIYTANKRYMSDTTKDFKICNLQTSSLLEFDSVTSAGLAPNNVNHWFFLV